MNFFPEDIENLPDADINIDGVKAKIFQGENHQIIFMEFSKDLDIPLHSHGAQWGIVLEGKIDLTINGELKTYIKGDRYFINPDDLHMAKIYKGYADISFFSEKERYKIKSV